MVSGQIWLLKSDDPATSLMMEVVLTDTKYASSIGVVCVAALTRVKNASDGKDVVLNKRDYPDTLSNGRVFLRLTECAIPVESLFLFIDVLKKEDWGKIHQTLRRKPRSHHIEPQMKLIGRVIEGLSELRNNAVAKYEKFLEQEKSKQS